MAKLSLFNVRFECKYVHNNSYLINYPSKFLGIKDLQNLRNTLNNNDIEYVDRSPWKIKDYVLTLHSNDVVDLPCFYEEGFLYCKVHLSDTYNFHKYIKYEYVYPDPSDLTYVRETISMNDELLFKEWKEQGCPNVNNIKNSIFNV